MASPVTLYTGCGATKAEARTQIDAADASTSPIVVLTARGDIMFRNATTVTRLPAGVAGQVLSTGGPGADPSWVASPGAIAGTGPVEVIGGVLTAPSVLGAAYTHRRVNSAGTALESQEDCPIVVDALNCVGTVVGTCYAKVLAENTVYNVKATIVVALANATSVGVFHRQALVKRATGGNVTLVDGPNTFGSDYLDVGLAGTTASIDVDVGTQTVRVRLSAVQAGGIVTRTRTTVELTPIVQP
jgi:hypothetical protein